MTAERPATTGPGSHAEIERDLMSFLEEQLRSPVERDQDLVDAGLITSMFAMQLVVRLEQTFDVSIVGPDLKMDHFRSVASMAELVHRLRHEASGDGS
ncbi:acyl carrier protein [Streptomyces sp. NBC_01795]|uniref:acyl carrier protein n=1 Tax=Streptomyces sp. NBC_01795 TaxID=2975943 RepID=UPI002DDA1984|nr:acyl carrier protein [Streptomyces sp. NBC_01795]WSA90513.1 acyl carrier protein [Streptomyces sp. NBC_01795]